MLVVISLIAPHIRTLLCSKQDIIMNMLSKNTATHLNSTDLTMEIEFCLRLQKELLTISLILFAPLRTLNN